MKDKIEKLSVKYQLKSFRWAFEGLSEFFRTEIKAWIHLVISLGVTGLGFILKLTRFEWCFVLIAIFGVIISELINTALERLAEKLPDAADSTRKTVKDMGAAMVLLAAIFALLIGIIILAPKILELLKML